MRRRDLNNVLSFVLRMGVVLSLALLLTGVTLIFVFNGADGYTLEQIANYQPASGSGGFTLNSSSIPLAGMLNGLIHLNGIYYISLGLWVLIFTPISIVVLALADFLMVKNRLYIVLSLIVLFDLFFAMFVVPLAFHV